MLAWLKKMLRLSENGRLGTNGERPMKRRRGRENFKATSFEMPSTLSGTAAPFSTPSEMPPASPPLRDPLEEAKRAREHSKASFLTAVERGEEITREAEA